MTEWALHAVQLDHICVAHEAELVKMAREQLVTNDAIRHLSLLSCHDQSMQVYASEAQLVGAPLEASPMHCHMHSNLSCHWLMARRITSTTATQLLSQPNF